MRILITGNSGYVGPCVTRQLRLTWPNARLTGVDTEYFGDCAVEPSGTEADQQVNADIRDLSGSVFNNVDAVVHLAALSNDSLAKTFESATDEINYGATADLAKKAKKAGVKSFVLASTCRVYAMSNDDAARTEASPLSPGTAYSRSKLAAEAALRSLAGREFTVTCLRFATACGMSPGLRLDTVLNNYVACAVLSGEVRVMSNPDAWLKLIHVRDMARAIDWAVARPGANGGSHVWVNAGSDAWTLRVGELAQVVADAIPHTRISPRVSFPREAAPDTGSYLVDFGLFRRLAPLHQPREKLLPSILELKTSLEKYLAQNGKDTSRLNRLKVLSRLVEQGQIDGDLRRTKTPGILCTPESREFAFSNPA